MSVLVFVESQGDELSRQALTLAERLDPDVHALAFDGPYAPAAWAKAIASGPFSGQFMSTMSGTSSPIALRAANTAGVVVSCSLIAE